MMTELYIDTVVAGTGCAGYNAADWLYTLGRRDVAIVTEGKDIGTSRNAGSDKQTYYKLSLAGNEQDSVWDMARTLFNGGCVNGDTALIEAACSVKCFIKLANLGVPFPTNIYGEYVGYQTDHDTRKRATSAGPLTSKYMTDALEASVISKGIRIIENIRIVKIIVIDGIFKGLLCININSGEQTVIFCNNVILATGGPAGIYKDSVYPRSQTGSLGLAVNAGVDTVNLQEWQYGIASVKFRWNLSGTYQQVLPRYIAVDKNGKEREFLPEYFGGSIRALNLVFQKGYQWPFDSLKAIGSSSIDLIIHKEIHEKGNRVFLDYRSEPMGLADGFEKLSDEARIYLEKSGALLKTPIERITKMEGETRR
jgi:succinate dehydrogenase/fumarate reductase flavoprotein subunit